MTIGPCTQIPARIYRHISWDGADGGKKAVRDLLVAAFSREVLTTSTLTGTVGNAKLASELEIKPCLDPGKLDDIIRKYGEALMIIS